MRVVHSREVEIMYNEERKEKFITNYTDSPKSAYYVRAVFKKFAQYEDNEWHDDLCMQSTEVLEPIINSQTGARMESAERALIVLKEYVKWCARNGIETADGVFGVRVDVVEAVKEQMVASPLHLQKKLDILFNIEDEQTMDCLYRAYIWMAYAGLTDVEALEVEISEVDLTDLVIRHNEKVYQLYKEARKTFEQACNLTGFKYKHKNYETTNSRYPGTKLMRGIKSDVMKLSTLRSVITKKTAAHNMKLSYKKIFYSGIFYRVYENERAGENISFADYVADVLEKNDYVLNRNRTLNKIANEMMRALEVDYDRWKCAFSI